MRVLVILLLASPVLAAGETAFRVAGRAVNSVTGAPVAGARIALERNRSEDSSVSVFTGTDGRFAFDQVSPGKYSLHGERRGYRTTHYGQTPMGPGVGLLVADGEKIDGIVFRLPPQSAIGGRIIDQAGEPVSYALVQLLVSAIVNGRRRSRVSAYRSTDDHGEYRFSGLAAGKYFLAVTAVPWYAGKIAGAAFAPQFYGGGTDPNSAAHVVLKAGDEATANFTMAATTGSTVTIRAPERGDHALFLKAPGVGGTDLWVSNQSAGGVLVARGVPAGRYRAGGYSGTARVPLAVKEVEVGGQDVEVKLDRQAPLTVSGKVAYHSERDRQPERSRVTLLNDSQGNRYERALGPGGAFSIPNVRPDRYRILLNHPDRVYLRQATAEGAPIEGGTIDLTAASGTVRLTIAGGGDGGTVKGILRCDGRPLPGANVALCPREESRMAADSRLYITDSDGSFDISAVRPGDYLLIASDEPELEYANPQVMRTYRRRATPVKVEAKSSQTVDLTLE